jgi:Leucine-rich repeat (LRR) protein
MSTNFHHTVTQLNLSSEALTRADLDDLASYRRLRSLDVSDTNFDDLALCRILPLTDLEELILARTQVTDAGVMEIDVLHNLRALSLAQTQVSNRSLRAIGHLSNLEWLNLSETCISDVRPLINLKSLRSLDLDGTQVGDDALPVFDALSDLAELSLHNTSVSVKDFRQLNRRRLDVHIYHIAAEALGDTGLIRNRDRLSTSDDVQGVETKNSSQGQTRDGAEPNDEGASEPKEEPRKGVGKRFR